MEELIHINAKRERPVFNVIFLLIPILIFTLLVILIIVKNPNAKQAAVSTEETTAVLGEETEIEK